MLKDFLLDKYNKLDDNSRLFQNNAVYFKDLLTRIENIEVQKPLSLINNFLSIFQIISQSQNSISLIEEMLKKIDNSKKILKENNESDYRNLLINDFEEKYNKIIDLSFKPIISISSLKDYITFYKDNTFDKHIANFNEYINLEQQIADYIIYIDDENTQLPSSVKQNYIYQLKDLHHILSIDNHKDVNTNFKLLSNKFLKALTEEKKKISKMLKEVDSDINDLNDILNNNYELHFDFQRKVEQLRHEALEVKTSIADSKYILSKFFITKNKIARIKNQYELLVLRSNLFNNVKKRTINMLSSYKKNISDSSQIQIMMNEVKSLSSKIHQNAFDESYKICENSKKYIYNNLKS